MSFDKPVSEKLDSVVCIYCFILDFIDNQFLRWNALHSNLLVYPWQNYFAETSDTQILHSQTIPRYKTSSIKTCKECDDVS